MRIDISSELFADALHEISDFLDKQYNRFILL